MDSDLSGAACLYHYYYPTDGDDVDDNCHDY